MNKARTTVIINVSCIVVMLLLAFPLVKINAETNHDHKGHGDKALTLRHIHFKKLPKLSQSIDKALKAIESKDYKKASAELRKVQKMIALINKAIGKHVKPKFANVRCPFMGSPINPGKVTKNLIREYKGQKIAFCCAKCPAKWDKLTDNEKDAKLAEAKPKSTHHDEHKVDKSGSTKSDEHHEEKGKSEQGHTDHEQAHGEKSTDVLPAGANLMCPMMPDEKALASLYVKFNGKKIYVCCKKCLNRVKDDPASWYAKAYGDKNKL
ncbi:MAG TPA: hypothetical protein ENI27_03110 [bacterium]|nr:hypothetical protein [bacterium]